MDDLLCHETWLSRPLNAHDFHDDDSSNVELPLFRYSGCDYKYENEEFEWAFCVCIEKEVSLMPEPNYVHYLYSNNLIPARCRSRLNLSFGTVFYAANYLDRFISICQCNDWKYWMVELLSITCLSTAIKFNETSAFSLHEVQMESLDHSYESNTILRMELILLQAVGWRLNTVTPYSIVETVVCYVPSSLRPNLHENIMSRVTKLLLQATLDLRMMGFRQSVVGISALWCSLEELYPAVSDAFIAYIMKLLSQSQKEDLIKCHKIMDIISTTLEDSYGHHYCSLSKSPTTVL
ncbi:putative cyclin-D7-1 isoform X2 [Prosopis cineraria]|uniref:putative cyclin-D7-1 isoform X2 n=1 Tax=Prosopis cineraria TaxID=364024 RepID=UPI0024100279|nr:putative cyclin-D7-1 isoform X2 [Prosopis cineraria]